MTNIIENDKSYIDGPFYLSGCYNRPLFMIVKNKLEVVPNVDDVIIDGDKRYVIRHVDQTIKLLAVDPPMPGSEWICICDKQENKQ